MFIPPQRLVPYQLHTTGCLAAAEIQPDPAEELSPASPEIHINFCHSELDPTEEPISEETLDCCSVLHLTLSRKDTQ